MAKNIRRKPRPSRPSPIPELLTFDVTQKAARVHEGMTFTAGGPQNVHDVYRVEKCGATWVVARRLMVIYRKKAYPVGREVHFRPCEVLANQVAVETVADRDDMDSPRWNWSSTGKALKRTASGSIIYPVEAVEPQSVPCAGCTHAWNCPGRLYCKEYKPRED